jgi:hypothetical protein
LLFDYSKLSTALKSVASDDGSESEVASVTSKSTMSVASKKLVDKELKIVDYEVVVVLAEPQASDPGVVFPKGARVCFDQKTSPDIKHLEACEGFVMEVSLGRDPENPMINGLVFIYTVEVMDGNDKKTQHFIQEHLAYASNCPVNLVIDGEVLAGEVAFATKVSVRGRSKLAYTVVTRKGGKVIVQKGVRPQMLSYRRIPVEPPIVQVVEERDEVSVEKKTSPIASMKKVFSRKKVNKERIDEDEKDDKASF